MSELEKEVERLRAQVQRLTLFTEVGKSLASSLDARRVLETIMEKVSDLLQPDTWSLLMLDAEKGELAFEIAVGEGAERLKDLRLPLGEGIAHSRDGSRARRRRTGLIRAAPAQKATSS